jgi:hypothetical protein
MAALASLMLLQVVLENAAAHHRSQLARRIPEHDRFLNTTGS